jgi:hypothetical protein
MSTYTADVVLGERYRDDQTGIEGTATAITFYQHGCERVSIETVVAGKIEEYGFDAPRLTHTDTSQRVMSSGRPGGAQPAVGRPGAVRR